MESREIKREAHIHMDAVEDADENELLGRGDDEQEDAVGTNDVDETAEDLMTDMKLEDELDEARNGEPDFDWTYFIEVYPWNAEDLTENFIKLIKLSQFSRIVMKKKKVSNESVDADEKSDEKLKFRQRKGCLQFYLADRQTAKAVMRSMTWKSMSSKELTIEVLRRDIDQGSTETAYLEVHSYSLCKCRYREKGKGVLKDRSAKVSNLPGSITQGFLEVVLNRAFPVIGGQTQKLCEATPSKKLREIEGFDGSLDYDCLTRGSCRAFVLSHKKVVLNGQQLSIVANDKQTMVVPPFTHDIGVKKKVEAEFEPSSMPPPPPPPPRPPPPFHFPPGNVVRGNLPMGPRGGPPGFPGPRMRGPMKDMAGPNVRGRGMGRAVMPVMRPQSAPFPRVGPGMPIPMTGRQKMNEKMRRNNLGMNSATAGGGPVYTVPGNSMNVRGPGPGSVGDSFKQEIASLQSQLERSTKELEAKIAMLQQSGGYYDTEMAGYDAGAWEEGDFSYNDDYGVEEYTEEDMYGMSSAHQEFPAGPMSSMQTGMHGGMPAAQHEFPAGPVSLMHSGMPALHQEYPTGPMTSMHGGMPAVHQEFTAGPITSMHGGMPPVHQEFSTGPISSMHGGMPTVHQEFTAGPPTSSMQTGMRGRGMPAAQHEFPPGPVSSMQTGMHGSGRPAAQQAFPAGPVPQRQSGMRGRGRGRGRGMQMNSQSHRGAPATRVSRRGQSALPSRGNARGRGPRRGHVPTGW